MISGAGFHPERRRSLAGQVLADLGAEVIKVEAPGGEAARHIIAVLPGRPPLATYFLPTTGARSR